MTSDDGSPAVGDRSYALQVAYFPTDPSTTSSEQAEQHGPWYLTEWDGHEWVGRGEVHSRAELNAWLAEGPSAV